jgi:hypothetical protein
VTLREATSFQLSVESNVESSGHNMFSNLLLGHASVCTTQEIYTHLTPDAEKRAAEKMDEIFGPVAVKYGTASVNWIVNY